MIPQLTILKEVIKEIWGNIKGLVWFVLIVAIILILWGLYRDAVAEKDRLQRNENALIEQARNYRTESEKNASSVQVLTLKKDELERYNAELVKTCEDLNIKLKRAQSISQAGTHTEYVIKGEVKDSIVYVRDRGAFDTLRCSEYRDPYLSFSYCTDSASIYTADIETFDTITAIVHRIPRRFLFFRFGTKEIRQEVVCANPHTRITTNTKVDIVK